MNYFFGYLANGFDEFSSYQFMLVFKSLKMRSTNTFGIHFVLRMNRGKNGKAAIYVRIVVNKSRCEVALKRMVDLTDWNQSKGLAKPKNETLKSLNSYLEQCRCILASHYQ